MVLWYTKRLGQTIKVKHKERLSRDNTKLDHNLLQVEDLNQLNLVKEVVLNQTQAFP